MCACEVLLCVSHEACVTVCVCFFSSVIQTEKLPIFNLEQTQLTRKQTIVPPHQGIDWYQATNEICIACLKLDLLFFFNFLFCLNIALMTVVEKLAFMCQHF